MCCRRNSRLPKCRFVEIGEKMGIHRERGKTRIKRLKAEGYIRRIGPVLDAKKLGYHSLLCAAAVEPDIIEELAMPSMPSLPLPIITNAKASSISGSP